MTLPDRRRITDQHKEPTGHGISYWRWDDERRRYWLDTPPKAPRIPGEANEWHFPIGATRWKATRAYKEIWK